MGKNVGTENFNILLLRSKISVVALSFHSLLFSVSFFLSFFLSLSVSLSHTHSDTILRPAPLRALGVFLTLLPENTFSRFLLALFDAKAKKPLPLP